MTTCFVFTKRYSHCQVYLSLNCGFGLIMTGFPRRGLSGHDQTYSGKPRPQVHVVPGSPRVSLRNVLSVSALCWEARSRYRTVAAAAHSHHRSGPDLWGMVYSPADCLALAPPVLCSLILFIVPSLRPLRPSASHRDSDHQTLL